MKSLKSLVLALVLAVASVAAMVAHAGEQDFILENQTGKTIWRIYVSDSGTDNWEEDLLGKNVLKDGESIQITIDDRTETYWDVKVEYSDGSDAYITHYNLKQIYRLVFFIKNDETYVKQYKL